jgi:uncharacterized protein (TIGR03083 family)
MTFDYTETLQAERKVLIELAEGLTSADWERPSGCAGWSVKDVISHLAALYWQVVDPSALPAPGDRATEDAQDFYVRQRRSMSPAEVLADYETVSKEAVETLGGLQQADFEIPLGDLGTYPASVLPAAFCFDHYTHIRLDLFSPRGPLTGPLPPSDELRVDPLLNWAEAAIPQQHRAAVEAMELSGAIEIDGRRALLVGPQRPPAATVRSDALSFATWATQRGDWESLPVETSGDPEVLATLRALHLY